MKETEAIEILKKARYYYCFKRPKYDAVIKWLEGRERRKKGKSGITKLKKSIVNDFNDLIDSLDTLRIELYNRCNFFLESIAELEARIEEYKEK